MRRIFYAPILFFILFLMFLVGFELYHGNESYNLVMENKAKELVNTIVTFRKWAAGVDNLYAKAENVEPSPYLAWRDDRDIDAEGYHLTMINPSYMTRLVSNLFAEKDGVKIHMVGVSPLNPLNSPNEWEQRGLEAFEKGADSFSEFSKNLFNKDTYKYISPLYVESACLSCHEREGYSEGDLIGGISVTIPNSGISEIMMNETIKNIFIYIILSSLLIFTLVILQNKIFFLNSKQKYMIDELNEEITHRELSENALMRQTRAASQGELLTLVAHHWRQPLNVMSLSFDLLKDEINDNCKTGFESVVDIEHAQLLIQDLSNSIDIFSQTFFDNKDIEEFSITKTMLTTSWAVKPVLALSDIKLIMKCQCDDDMDSMCICSSVKRDEDSCPLKDINVKGSLDDFSQIILSLLKNSYEAIIELKDNGDKHYKGFIAVDVNIYADRLNINIRDNGCGIKENIRDMIFEPYFTTKGYDYGRGMGLYFAKIMASNFKNGSLTFSDKSDITEFTLSFDIDTKTT